MSMQNRYRFCGNVVFQANSPVEIDLPRGMTYKELYLKLSGAPTLTAANNTAAKTLQGDEWAVVTRIDIIANGVDTIRSFSGNELWWLNYFLYRQSPFVTPGIGDTSTANPTFYSVLNLPFWSVGTVRPIDTLLDARILSDLKLRITWGQYTSINADASAWTTEPTIKVYSLESMLAEGPFSKWNLYKIRKEITSTNSQFEIQLKVGPVYRGFLLNFTDAGADDGTILNNFKWIAGTTTFADLTEEVLRQGHHIRHGYPRILDSVGHAYLNLRRGTTYNSVLGWYYYEHCPDGYLSEGVDTLGFSEHKLELDVTVGAGTTYCHVIPMEYIPLRAKQAA